MNKTQSATAVTRAGRTRSASLFKLSLALLSLLPGCTPVYQMSRESDESMRREVPELSGSFWDRLRGKKIDRAQVIGQALYPIGLNLNDIKTDLPDCSPKAIPKADLGAGQLPHGAAGQLPHGAAGQPPGGTGLPKLPHGCVEFSPDGKTSISLSSPIAAIIRAAALECIYWTYKQDTTAVDQNVLLTALGTLALGGGVLAATQGASKGAATTLAAAGAGTALANWQKTTPPIVSSVVHNIIQEGVDYYPFLQMRIESLRERDQMDPTHIVSVLSELWDVAGSACPGGVLKGASWFNKYAN
jgi:hypothetical protein